MWDLILLVPDHCLLFTFSNPGWNFDMGIFVL